MNHSSTLLFLFLLLCSLVHAQPPIPTTAAAAEEYLTEVWEQALPLYRQNDYAGTRQLLQTALVRVAAVVDSCATAPPLFSLLAECYEQQGDTIMPERFHRKAQELSLFYDAIMQHPDSAEVYKQRSRRDLAETHRGLHPDGPATYGQIFNVSLLTRDMAQADNAAEVVWLGERALRLAREAGLEHSDCLDVHAYLLYGYAALGEGERAEALLPEAQAFYRQSSLLTTDAYLYYMLGYGYMQADEQARALVWFEKVLKDKSIAVDPSLREEVETIIKEVKANQRKAKEEKHRKSKAPSTTKTKEDAR